MPFYYSCRDPFSIEGGDILNRDGVVPEYYHSTSMYPEYFKIDDSDLPRNAVSHHRYR